MGSRTSVVARPSRSFARPVRTVEAEVMVAAGSARVALATGSTTRSVTAAFTAPSGRSLAAEVGTAFGTPAPRATTGPLATANCLLVVPSTVYGELGSPP